MDPERVDLEALVDMLAETFRQVPPEGEVMGRTLLRDAVAARLACSQLEAERLVDTLVLRGCVKLVEVPGELPVWHIEVSRGRDH